MLLCNQRCAQPGEPHCWLRARLHAELWGAGGDLGLGRSPPCAGCGVAVDVQPPSLCRQMRRMLADLTWAAESRKQRRLVCVSLGNTWLILPSAG